MHERAESEWLAVATRRPYRPGVEVVERKGIGHPDTLCDHLAEQLSRRLASWYRSRTGALRHFNVDKGLLVAGAVDVGFGRGRCLRPFRVILAGRAEPFGNELPIEELTEGLREEVRGLLPDLGRKDFSIEVQLNPPSADLAGLAAAAEDPVPLANDTSVAVVSLPRSPLEEVVDRVERHLSSGAFRRRVPIGADIKVMGVRFGDRTELTVAAALLGTKVADAEECEQVRAAVAEVVAGIAGALLGPQVQVAVNPADGARPYLTLSGSSAEAGDDGQVGRGNRFGGLITPFRPMSLEACAGKNPLRHVGKTYHAIAQDVAESLLAEPGVEEVTVMLVSRIGAPVTRPRLVHVAIAGQVEHRRVAEIVEARLGDWRGACERLLEGRYRLY